MTMKIQPEANGHKIIKRILVRHILALFRDRERVPVRRNFIAVIRDGGFRVVRPRGLKCCDIVLLETALGPEDHVSEQLIEQCMMKYINWELKF